MSTLLASGLHVWLWPKRGWSDPARVAADMRALGLDGVIPQASDNAPAWCRTHGHHFLDAGLRLTVGLGKLPTAAILAGLDVPGADGVMLDWEGAWDGARARADGIATEVIARHGPGVADRIADCPWWAPLYYRQRSGRKAWTHPSAPTREFGRIVTRRFVQAYGANVGPEDGHSGRLLAWARDPSQYASMGRWEVRAALQMYRRSVADHLALILQELPSGAVCLWDWQEMDLECRTALEVVRELRAVGRAEGDETMYLRPEGIRAFQTAEGLTADGIVGPRTAAALGLKPPADVVWSHRG